MLTITPPRPVSLTRTMGTDDSTLEASMLTITPPRPVSLTRTMGTEHSFVHVSLAMEMVDQVWC